MLVDVSGDDQECCQVDLSLYVGVDVSGDSVLQTQVWRLCVVSCV